MFSAENRLVFAIADVYSNVMDGAVCSQQWGIIGAVLGVTPTVYPHRFGKVSSNVGCSRRDWQYAEHQDKGHDKGKHSRRKRIRGGGTMPSGCSSHVLGVEALGANGKIRLAMIDQGPKVASGQVYQPGSIGICHTSSHY